MSSVAAVSNGLCHRPPLIEIPAVASRSMAVNAKLSVLPSFHPSRPKIPTSFVSSWSILRPNPYLSVPLRCVSETTGGPRSVQLAGSLQRSSLRWHDSGSAAPGSSRRVFLMCSGILPRTHLRDFEIIFDPIEAHWPRAAWLRSHTGRTSYASAVRAPIPRCSRVRQQDSPKRRYTSRPNP